MPIIYDMPMSEYKVLDAFSSGVAFKALMQSPIHALQSRTETYSAVADKGTVAHQILLEGHEDNIVVVDADDWRTKAAKEARDAAYKEGKTPLLTKDMPSIRAMVTAAQRYVERTEIAGVFGTGKAEVTVTWDDDGVPCKARPDYLTKDWHISVKTTESVAEPVAFSKRMLVNSGYDFSLAFYKRGLQKNDINVEHRILVIEQKPPYACCLIGLDAMKEALCDADVQRAIEIWRECLRTQNFYGYPVRTHWAEATPWQIAESEMREVNNLVEHGVKV